MINAFHDYKRSSPVDQWHLVSLLIILRGGIFYLGNTRLQSRQLLIQLGLPIIEGI